MNAVGWCLRDAVYAGHHGHFDFIEFWWSRSVNSHNYSRDLLIIGVVHNMMNRTHSLNSRENFSTSLAHSLVYRTKSSK